MSTGLVYGSNGGSLAHEDDHCAPTLAYPVSKLAAERLAGFAKQMLAYTGRDYVQVVPLDLAKLTRESLALLAANVPPHIYLDCALPSTLAEVQGDVRVQPGRGWQRPAGRADRAKLLAGQSAARR